MAEKYVNNFTNNQNLIEQVLYDRCLHINDINNSINTLVIKNKDIL